MKSKMQKTEVNSHHEHVQGFRLRILISVVLKEKGTGMTNTVVYISPITSKVINLHAAFRHSGLEPTINGHTLFLLQSSASIRLGDVTLACHSSMCKGAPRLHSNVCIHLCKSWALKINCMAIKRKLNSMKSTERTKVQLFTTVPIQKDAAFRF